MSVEQNKAAMRRLWEGKEFKGLAKQETERAIRKVLAEDWLPSFVVHSSGVDLHLEDYVQYLTARQLAFPDETCTIEDIVADGDLVFARMTVRGTHRHDFFGFPATGKQIEERLVAVGRFSDGKGSEGWGYYWAGNIMQLLGAGPGK